MQIDSQEGFTEVFPRKKKNVKKIPEKLTLTNPQGNNNNFKDEGISTASPTESEESLGKYYKRTYSISLIPYSRLVNPGTVQGDFRIPFPQSGFRLIFQISLNKSGILYGPYLGIDLWEPIFTIF